VLFTDWRNRSQAVRRLVKSSSCKRHKINPHWYLTDVLEQLSANPDCDLERLFPTIGRRSKGSPTNCGSPNGYFFFFNKLNFLISVGT
jgi:hypothetical protein